MAANQPYKFSAHLPNTLDLGPRGFVWVQFLSPHAYPMSGLKCSLLAEEYQWSSQTTDAEGKICWQQIPFLDLEAELELGERSLKVAVPWLSELTMVHSQRLLDLEALLGSEDDSFSIQLRLKSLGYDCDELDGIIGPKTKAAVRRFQQDSGLVVDGIAGEATQTLLIESFGA